MELYLGHRGALGETEHCEGGRRSGWLHRGEDTTAEQSQGQRLSGAGTHTHVHTHKHLHMHTHGVHTWQARRHTADSDAGT